MRGVPNNKISEKKHSDLIKKFGRSKFKDSKDFIKNAGVWEGERVSVDKLRELAWKQD